MSFRLLVGFSQASLESSVGVSICFSVVRDLDKGVQLMALTSGFALCSRLLSGLRDREACSRDKGGTAPRCEIHSTILKRPSLDEDTDISLGDQTAKPDGIGGFSLEFMAVI